METVRAGVLDVAYERHGPRDGWPVVLLHGFPYDPRCFDEVVGPLAAAGADVVVPYLRGYGPTRFVDPATPRSGQQAALAHDLLALVDALGLDRPVVGGFDWGGRAACLVAALWPERVSGLVTADGYNVQDIAASGRPAAPATESALWYQYYLHGERGRRGLQEHRHAFARLLWEQWSPGWRFTDADVAATAPSFDNPDFVDVVVHSYRHRYALAAGDPAYDATEARIAAQPRIDVPTVVLDAAQDGLGPPAGRAEHERHFSALVEHRVLQVGHDVPQEAPTAFAAAVLLLHGAPTAEVGEPDGYDVSTDPARVDLDVLWSFLSTEAYWGRWRTRQDVVRQVEGAWRVVGAYRQPDGAMVGFARAVADDRSLGYLADVFVLPAHRGRGLGSRLVAEVVEAPPADRFRWLLHTADAHGLYARFGFAPGGPTLLERPGRPRT